MWEMTHKIISFYLVEFKKYIVDNWPIPDTQKIIQDFSASMEKTFFLSKETDFTDFVAFGLSEHFYNTMEDNSLEVILQKVIINFNSFLGSDYHKQIENRFRKGHHIYIENPWRVNFDIMKVNIQYIPWLEKISVLASPDFWIMFGENNYLILDWKSGKESLDVSWITDQLRVYALKTLLKQKNTLLWNRHIDVQEIYLPSLHKKAWTIQQEDIEYIINKIKEDIEYQKQFLVDQDIEKNQALNHTAFTRTSNEKKCTDCSFRLICQQLKEKEIQ